jgi:hypothetical protein
MAARSSLLRRLISRARSLIRRARQSLGELIAPRPITAAASASAGPPAHWLAKVRDGAPHLLEPDGAEGAQDDTPVERNRRPVREWKAVRWSAQRIEARRQRVVDETGEAAHQAPLPDRDAGEPPAVGAESEQHVSWKERRPVRAVRALPTIVRRAASGAKSFAEHRRPTGSARLRWPITRQPAEVHGDHVVEPGDEPRGADAPLDTGVAPSSYEAAAASNGLADDSRPRPRRRKTDAAGDGPKNSARRAPKLSFSSPKSRPMPVDGDDTSSSAAVSEPSTDADDPQPDVLPRWPELPANIDDVDVERDLDDRIAAEGHRERLRMEHESGG